MGLHERFAIAMWWVGCVIVTVVTWSANTSTVFLLTIYIEHGH